MRIETIIARKGINDDNLGKKHALHKLISASSADYVWLMDDDVVAPIVSEDELLDAIGNADMLIMPLRMQSESPNPTCLEQLQIAEYAAIWQLSIETAERGDAIMCSGANMLVKRDCWMASWPDIHPEIASGDDMFLLESIKRRGGSIKVAKQAKFEATIRPKKHLSDLLHQRMRWAGKAPHYQDKGIIRYGAWVVGINMLQLLCPVVLPVKFSYEYQLIKRREPATKFGVALLLEVLYPIYILVCLLGGISSRRAW